MSKNLTRKGLALGAIVALGSTLLAGTPASAAPGITIAPDKGTSYSFLSGEEFSLKVYGNSEFTTGFTNLKWEVKNTSATAVTARATNGLGALAAANPAVSAATDATSTVTPAGIETTAGGNKLALAVAATAEASYQVRAYIELDGTAGLTAGDLASQSETVTFVKQANVTSTVAITSPVEGNTAVTASVRFNNINNEQLTNTEIGLGFTKGDDNVLNGTPSNVQKVVAAWSATDGFVAATSAISALVKDTAVKVQAFYKDGGVAYTSAEKIGAAQTATVVARKAATITSDALASTSIKNTVTAGTATAKTNSTFVVRALVKDGSTTRVAVANASVSAVVTAAGLSTTKTLAVNGTTYTSSTALPGQTGVAKLALTTDASGYASVTLTTVGFSAATGAITVAFTTENLPTATQTVDLADAAYTLSVNDASVVASAADGSLAPVAVSVYDQFGGVPADKYDVTATLTGSTQATTAATATGSNANAALVGGKAVINLGENGTGNGTNSFNLEVKERLAGNVYGSTVVTAVAYSVKIVDAAALVPGVVTSSTGTQNSTTKVYEVAGPVALSLNDVKNADTRKVLETAPTFTNTQALAGSVTTASSATLAAVAVAGAKVTISGAGLQFNAGSVYAADSITVATAADGSWSASVASNKAGKQTITVTSGAASATITVVFKSAAADTATVSTVVADATSLPGRTVTFSGTLTDKYGNPVFTTGNASGQTSASTTNTFSVSYAGPGYVLSTLPTATDADGKWSFKVLLGASDAGSAVVTVKYDADGTGTAATEIVKTATTAIATAVAVEPTSKIGTANSRVYVNVKDGKGSVVTVKIGAKWFTRSALNNDYTLSFKAAKGKKVSVKVYVDGDLSSSKTITVK